MDGFANPSLEGMGGNPAELALDLGRVDGIAAIMAGSVLNKSNQSTGVASECWPELVDDVANQLDNTDIGPLVVSTDVVRIAVCASGDDLPEGFAVVGHIEPIAHVHAVAINRDGLAIQDLLYDDRDEFLGELERTVVVRAITNDYR